MSRARRRPHGQTSRGARGLPRCPGHLTAPAAREWRRVATSLHEMGVVTTIDRAALAAYCQAYGRWVEAEERMRESQMLYKTPSGHVQQSPLLAIINKQLELMGRYRIELGITPAARSRVAVGLTNANDITHFEIAELSDDELNARIQTQLVKPTTLLASE